MLRSRGKMLLGVAASLLVSSLACVDLFHSTSFDTLCTTSPDDPACGGDGGAADAIADVAVDAVKPHPDFCTWSSAEARTQALRACAFLGACEGTLGETVFGKCVIRAQLAFDCGANPTLRPLGATDAFWGCMSTAKTCADVDACVFPGGFTECVDVEAGSSETCGKAANAITHLRCSGPKGRAVGIEPCVMLNKTCTVEDPPNGSFASCTGGLGFDTCTRTACSDTKAVDCQAAGARKLDHGLDCADYGAGRCVDDSTVGPVCAPGTAAADCTSAPAVHCDGTVAASCVAGKEIRVDCNRLGLICDVTTAAPPPYDPTAACVGTAAAPCTDPDACSGTKLTSCARGARFEVDCATLGLGTCKKNATNDASCTAPK